MVFISHLLWWKRFLLAVNVPERCFTCHLSQCQNIYQHKTRNLGWKWRHLYLELVSLEVPVSKCLEETSLVQAVFTEWSMWKSRFEIFHNLPLETWTPPRLLWWLQSSTRRARIIQKCIVDVMVALFSEKAHLKGISDVQTGSLLLQPFDA